MTDSVNFLAGILLLVLLIVVLLIVLVSHPPVCRQQVPLSVHGTISRSRVTRLSAVPVSVHGGVG